MIQGLCHLVDRAVNSASSQCLLTPHPPFVFPLRKDPSMRMSVSLLRTKCFNYVDHVNMNEKFFGIKLLYSHPYLDKCIKMVDKFLF